MLKSNTYIKKINVIMLKSFISKCIIVQNKKYLNHPEKQTPKNKNQLSISRHSCAWRFCRDQEVLWAPTVRTWTGIRTSNKNQNYLHTHLSMKIKRRLNAQIELEKLWRLKISLYPRYNFIGILGHSLLDPHLYFNKKTLYI